jgi:hypothetical protein
MFNAIAAWNAKQLYGGGVSRPHIVFESLDLTALTTRLSLNQGAVVSKPPGTFS